MKLTRFVETLCCLCLIVAGSVLAFGQAAPKPVLSPPMTAKVSVGGGDVTIDYGAPSVRGRKIFGGLVPYGEVWRTGANPATTLTTTVSLKIGDLDVPAGKYTVYSLPTAEGWQLDGGAYVSALERAAEVTATVCGKPAPAYFASALELLGVDAGRALMVGDDMVNDVLGAQAAGIRGALVRTGKFQETDLAKGRPDYVLDTFADLPGLLGA